MSRIWKIVLPFAFIGLAVVAAMAMFAARPEAQFTPPEPPTLLVPTGEIAREYALGYAPAGWDNLLTALADDTAAVDAIAAGLVVDRPEEKKRYDRFRDRAHSR